MNRFSYLAEGVIRNYGIAVSPLIPLRVEEVVEYIYLI